MAGKTTSGPRVAVCLRNEGHEASLDGATPFPGTMARHVTRVTPLTHDGSERSIQGMKGRFTEQTAWAVVTTVKAPRLDDDGLPLRDP